MNMYTQAKGEEHWTPPCTENTPKDHKKIPKRISKTYLDVHKSSFCQLKNKGHKLLGTTPISNKYPYWYQRLTSALVRRIKGVDLQIAT